MQERGLAAAVGADDTDLVAASDQQRELADLRFSLAVGEVQIFGFYY